MPFNGQQSKDFVLWTKTSGWDAGMIDWEAIGAIGEIGSAIAVVVTLIYLGKQLQSTAKQQKMDGHRAISEEFNRINDIWLDEQQTGKLIRAWSDWDSATPQEQHLAWVFFTKVMNHVQTMFLMWKAGTIDESVYLAEQRATCQFLVTSGGKRWWEMMQNGHSERFVEQINSALASDEFSPIIEALPFWKSEHWLR